jgi:PAS domain S-box-containing protein
VVAAAGGALGGARGQRLDGVPSSRGGPSRTSSRALPPALAPLAERAGCDAALLASLGDGDASNVALLVLVAAEGDAFADARLPAIEVAAGAVAVCAARMSAAEREAAVAESELRFRAFMDALPAVAWIKDHEGRYAFLNAEYERLWRLRAEAYLGKTDFDIFAPEQAEPMRAHDDTVRRERRILHVEETASTADGGRRDWISTKFPIVQPGGEVHVGGIAIDVTERKACEHRREMQDRLASLGTLAAGVAHEINNPLTTVVMNLEMLRELASEPALSTSTARELPSLVDEARSGAERVRRIVRAMRAFTRPSGVPLGPIGLELPIEEAIQLTDRVVRARARLVDRLEPTPKVVADETQITQVLVNLLTNAAQAIELGASDRHRIELAAFTDEEGDAVIEVRDDGPGIAPELVGRIFDPFFTTKETGLGTGLGLSIAHGIVTSIGGDISVRSEPGRGATFRVRLPAAAPAAATDAPSSTRLRVERRARLLIVDADVALSGSIARALRPRFDVETAPSARAALERVGNRRFDLLLAEADLIDADADSFLRAVERTSPRLAARTVFMRSGEFVDQGRPPVGDDARPWLDKPLALDELTVVLDRVAAGA